MKPMIAKAFLLAAFVPILLLASCAPPDAWVTARERIAAEAAKHYEVSLGVAGDICFADNYVPMEHLAEIGSTNIADGIDQRFIDLMRSMDLMWINNEFCYSDRGEPLEGKMYTFRGSPSHVTYLDELGIDIAGLANNHVFDYGEVAFLDTLATLEGDNMPYVGAGRNIDEAKAPVYLKANGLTIAYIAASCAEYTVYTPEATATSPGILLCYDDTLVINAIREARANADYVVVLPHWGVEHSTELESSQIDSAHAYIDAGADAVIGGMPTTFKVSSTITASRSSTTSVTSGSTTTTSSTRPSPRSASPARATTRACVYPKARKSSSSYTRACNPRCSHPGPTLPNGEAMPSAGSKTSPST